MKKDRLSGGARIALGLLAGVGSVGALQAEDLAWVPMANTNRAPASVSAPVSAAVAVVAVRGDEQTSAGRNVSTCVPGSIWILR